MINTANRAKIRGIRYRLVIVCIILLDSEKDIRITNVLHVLELARSLLSII